VSNAATQTAVTAKAPAKPTGGGLLQRKCACGNHTTAGGECEECGKKKLQRKAADGGAVDMLEAEADRSADQIAGGLAPGHISAIDAQLQRRASEPLTQPGARGAELQSASGNAGETLDIAVRGDMESSFGHDFSGVRIHADGDADRRAQEEDALAFTIGDDIFFRHGAYAPHTRSGRWLLAHELTHVVQQSGGGRGPQAYGDGAQQPIDALEHEADVGAGRAVSGQSVDVKLRTHSMLLAFPMCRSILDAREEEVIPESTVQRDLATRLAASGPVERELPIPAASFDPYRTTDRRRPRQVDPQIFEPYGRAGDGSADLALLRGQQLEVAEVKRGDWQLITEAERQLENYVQKAGENLPFVQERWGRRRGVTPVITSVRAMPTTRLNIPSPIRLGANNTPTSVSWCRDGVISFKAIGSQDANIFVCGATTRSPDSFVDSLVSRAELIVDQVIDGRVVPAIDRAIQATSTRAALERLRADPAFNRLLQNMLGPAASLINVLDGAGPMLDQLDALIHGQADRVVRIAIETMKDQVIAEIRRTVKQQVRRALQDALNALCVAAAQVTADEVLRELRRRMNQMVAQAIPVAVVAVLGAVLARVLAAAGEALLEALKYLAIAVGIVIAAIALWEVAAAIAAGAALAEIGAAIAAFFSQLARLLWPLVFA